MQVPNQKGWLMITIRIRVHAERRNYKLKKVQAGHNIRLCNTSWVHRGFERWKGRCFDSEVPSRTRCGLGREKSIGYLLWQQWCNCAGQETKITREIQTQFIHIHLIRKFVERGDVKLCKIHTDANVIDLLTKPFPQPKHEAHTRAMGIRCLDIWCRDDWL